MRTHAAQTTARRANKPLMTEPNSCQDLFHALGPSMRKQCWPARASVRRADLAVVNGAERALLHHLHARRPAA